MKKEYFSTVIVLLILVVFFSCDKEEKVVVPSVETASVDEIYNTSARVGVRVADNGGAPITDCGVYWSTSAKPETSGTKLQIGTGNGTFYQTLSGLTSGVKYYVKAYAISPTGTSYGDETFFTTQISLPTVATSLVTEFTSTSASIGGNVSDNGGFEVTQRGLFWGTEPNPRLTGKKLALGSGNGAFSQTITGLSRAYTYYVIAYATNIKGTSFGTEINFSTEPELSTVITSGISDITAYSARVGGTVSSSGGTEITERGIYWGTSPTPQTTGTKLIIGSGTGSYSELLANLLPGRTYYVIAYAINGLGTSFGQEKSWTSPGNAPTVKHLKYTNLTASRITLNGQVSFNDLTTNVTFEYGTTPAYGSNAIPADNPVTKDLDSVSVNISGLTPQTLYHYRIKAENALGIVLSADSTFTTFITGIEGTVEDSEGNSYKTIGIGYQQWMAENLKTTKFSNGDSIPLVKNDSVWNTLSTPGFSWYDDAEGNKNIYGALYNWFTVTSPKKLCPAGWHVPTNEDISKLVSYTGGSNVAGGMLKEAGNAHWNSPNTGATNDYLFTALGGGKKLTDGSYDFVKVEGNWWSSTEYSTVNGSYLNILFNYSNSFQAYSNKKIGMSVRCVKD